MRFCAACASTPLYHPPHGADAFLLRGGGAVFLFPEPDQRVQAAGFLAVQAQWRASACECPAGDLRRERGRGSSPEPAAGQRQCSGLVNRVTFLGRVSEKEKLGLYAHCLGVLVPAGGRGLRLRHAGGHACVQAGHHLRRIRAGRWSSSRDGAQRGGGDRPGAGGGRRGAMARAGRRPRPGGEALGRTGREDYLRRNITWDAVVETLLLAQAMKVAWFSPLPPAHSEIANFHRAVCAGSCRRVSHDVRFSTRETEGWLPSSPPPARRTTAGWVRARHDLLVSLNAGDVPVYNLGNNPSVLLRRRGS